MIAVLLCIASRASAHETITGKIVDSQTQQAIWGANVYLEGTNIGTTSDELGKFVLMLDSLPESIAVSYLGYTLNSFTPIHGESLIVSLEKSNLSLEEVSVQGNANSAPSHTIGALDLKLKPVKSSQDILRTIPGLFIGQHAGGGKAEQIFLRGYDIDHGTDLSITVDGLPVNMVSHAHGQGYADLHFLIPELIAKVDFNKGPHYSSVGNFATTGFVNFSTVNSLEKNRVQIEAGSFKTFRVFGAVNLLNKPYANKKNQEAFIATEYINSDGPFESSQDFNRFNVFYKHSYKLSEKNYLKFQASHFRSSWNASGQIPVSAVEDGIISRFGAIDDDEGGNTERTNIGLSLNTYLSKKSSLKSQIFYSKYRFTLFSNFTFFLEDQENGDRIKQQENRNVFGGNTVYTYQTRKNGVKYISSVGTGVRYDMVEDNELAHVLGRDSILEQYAFGNIDETNYHVFAKQTFMVKKWIFDLGVRIDYFNFRYQDKLQNDQQLQANAATINPKIGAAYNFNQDYNVFLKVSSGFHSNDTRSAVYAQSNREILPKVYGADLGVNMKVKDRLLMNVTGWTLYQENELVYVGDAGIVEQNGQSFRTGVDVSARLQILDWLFAEGNMNYTFARSLESDKGENYVPLAPNFTSTGGLFVQHKSGFNGGLSYRYLADRSANEDYSLTAQGYTLLDLVVNYTAKKYELGISIDNLLNSEWREAQFETESRISPESEKTSEIHFTPGAPFNIKAKVAFFF